MKIFLVNDNNYLWKKFFACWKHFFSSYQRIFLLPIIIIRGKIFYFWSPITIIVRDRILFWSPVNIIRDGILFWSPITIIRDGILFWLTITITSMRENYFSIVDNHYPRENFFESMTTIVRDGMFSFFISGCKWFAVTWRTHILTNNFAPDSSNKKTNCILKTMFCWIISSKTGQSQIKEGEMEKSVCKRFSLHPRQSW